MVRVECVIAASTFVACSLVGCGVGGDDGDTLSDLKDCVVVEEQHPADNALPHVDYIGYGYHIYKANPKEKGGSDPGFKQPIFQLQYGKNRKTADGRYSVPDGTNAVGVSACETDVHSQKILGTKSYSKSLSTSIDASVGYGAFSASAGYSTVSENTGSSSDNSVFVESSAKCAVYKVSIQTSNAPQVTRNFANAVSALPRQYNNDTATTFFEFIDEWGSHAAMSLEMGGRWGSTSQFTSLSYKSMVSSGTTVKAGASASFLVEAKVEMTDERKKQEAQSFQDARKDQSVFNIGGQYSQDSETWMKTLKEDPMPIGYELKDISDLMDSKYMSGCNADSLRAAKAGLKTALSDYCKQHAASKWPGVTCEALKDDPPPPLIRSQYKSAKDGGKWDADRTDPARECDEGTYVTGMDVWYTPSGDPPVGVANGQITCSDGKTMVWGQSEWTAAGGELQHPTQCGDAGYGEFRLASKSCSGIVAGEFKCHRDDNKNSLVNAALMKDASWFDWVQCPEDMPVLVGVQDRYCSCYSKKCGIDTLGWQCGNDNEVAGAALARSLLI